MKAIIYISFLCLSSATQAVMNDYDIAIICENSPETPTRTVELKLNSLAQGALLKYQGADATDVFKVAIQDAVGPNSSSDVWIKNGSMGLNGGVRQLSIGGHKTESFHVTHFAQFSFELEEDANGAYKAKSISMSKGTREFPESIKEKSIDVENMTCIITKINHEKRLWLFTSGINNFN